MDGVFKKAYQNRLIAAGYALGKSAGDIAKMLGRDDEIFVYRLVHVTDGDGLQPSNDDSSDVVMTLEELYNFARRILAGVGVLENGKQIVLSYEVGDDAGSHTRLEFWERYTMKKPRG